MNLDQSMYRNGTSGIPRPRASRRPVRDRGIGLGLALCGLCLAVNAQADVRYVSPAGSAVFPYATWATAATSIQQALDVCAYGDEVRVTNGVYDSGSKVASPGLAHPNRIVVPAGVAVRSVNGPESTVILGGTVRCAYLESSAVLDGFTLRGGTTASSGREDDQMGGGAWASGFAAITNCAIENCSANLDGGGFSGLSGASLYNCVIRSNSAARNGGGGGKGNAQNCTFAGNMASVNGGGAAGMFLEGCLLESNRAFNAGGAYDGEAEGCVFRGNSAAERGGGSFGTSSENGWYVDNVAGTSGGGAYQGTHRNAVAAGNAAFEGGGFSHAAVQNCTVAGNRAIYGAVFSGSATNTICYYNDVQELELWANRADNCCAPSILNGVGSGNFTNAPLLSSLRQPHLLPESPCIDAGIYAEWMDGSVDLDGEERIADGIVDVGCDEWHASSAGKRLAVSISGPTQIVAGTEIQLEAVIQGFPTEYAWTLPRDEHVANQPVVAYVFDSPGEFELKLVAQDGSSIVTGTLQVAVLDGYDVYVAPDGDDAANRPYTDPKYPAETIQAAVDAAVLGGTVWVADGVYAAGTAPALDAVPTRVVAAEPVAIRGTGRREDCVIAGGPGVRGVYLGKQVRLENVTVRDASGVAEGAGVWCETGAVISNAVICSNAAARLGGGVFGGMVHSSLIESNSALNGGGVFRTSCRDSLVKNNRARVDEENDEGGGGGGGNQSMFDRCTLEGNVGETGGGADDSVLTNCVVKSNVARVGGGVHLCFLDGCLVTGNKALASGGGAYKGQLVHCTVVANLAYETDGGVGEVEAINSIVYHNTAWFDRDNVGEWCDFAYCCLPTNELANLRRDKKGSSEDFFGDLNPGEGNFDDDPLLAKPDTGFLVRPSPCRDRGVDWAELPFAPCPEDLEGDLRTDGLPDVGCDEIAGEYASQVGAEIEADFVRAVVGEPLDFTAAITGKTVRIKWDFGDGSTEQAKTTVSHAFASRGIKTVTLTALNDQHDCVVTQAVEVLDRYATYVWSEAKPVAPHDTPETAAHDVQTAIDANDVKGSRVVVMDGTFSTGSRAAIPGGLPNRVVVDKPLSLETDRGQMLTIRGAQGEEPCRGVWLGPGASIRNFKVVDGGATLKDDWGSIHNRNGGGILAMKGATATDCVISNNAAFVGGGVYGGSLERCQIRNNEALNDGGGAADAALANSVLAGNRANEGAAFDCRLSFCTVADNEAPAGHPAGVLRGACFDSIVCANRSGGVDFNWSDAAVTNCCVDPLPDPANSCFAGPPGFLAADGTYALRYLSPAIDRGTGKTGDYDVTGRARSRDGDFDGTGHPDVGALEYDPSQTDSDGDEMPDDFEHARPSALDPLDADDAEGHADDDGQCNRDEYVAGTDLEDPDSFFHVGYVQNGGDVNEVSWPSVAGRRYTVSYGFMEDGEFVFTPISPDVLADAPTNTYFHNVEGLNPLSKPMYYRLHVRKQP